MLTLTILSFSYSKSLFIQHTQHVHRSYNYIIGHVPRKLSAACALFLRTQGDHRAVVSGTAKCLVALAGPFSAAYFPIFSFLQGCSQCTCRTALLPNLNLFIKHKSSSHASFTCSVSFFERALQLSTSPFLCSYFSRAISTAPHAHACMGCTLVIQVCFPLYSMSFNYWQLLYINLGVCTSLTH